MRFARNVTSSGRSSRGLIPALATSMLLLAGCETVHVKADCLNLPDPPPAIVDALEAAGREDPSAAAWVIDLDRHYQKQDACREAR